MFHLHPELNKRTAVITVMMFGISFWWILAGAAALAALWVVRVFHAGLNADMFVSVIKKIIHDKNVPRALKLCAAAGNVPLGTATKAALLASVSREEETNRPTSYRGNRPVSMDAVRARIRARYDEAFTTSASSAKFAFFLAIPSPLLFGAVLFLSLSGPDQDWKIIGTAGVGLLFWLYVGWSHIKIISSRNAGFETLWPSFEAVYHDRHAINMENKPAYPWTETPAPDVKNPQITFEILEPGKPLRTVAFDQPVIKIGSLATAHVQLAGEGVARMHAVVEIADGKATIIDLGAAKQTRVNLENVNKRELGNGDVIGIGDVEMVVRLGATGNVAG